MDKTLVLFAHPFFEHSTFNSEILDIYKFKEHITFKDLYEEFPDFHIPVFKERKLIKKYNRIIFHFPIIWLSIPPLLSLWVSEVFDMKWLNKNHENPLKGKKAVIIATAGGSSLSYSEKGTYQKNIEDFIAPLINTLKLCRMEIEDIIIVHSAKQKTRSEIESIKKQISNLT